MPGYRYRQMRVICLFLLVLAFAFPGRAQERPSNEEFVNAVFPAMGYDLPAYYLVMGADTCRFEKFDYDEWVKYHLTEEVPLTTLNELAYKVHLARIDRYWDQGKLKKAVTVTAARADSLLSSRSGDSLKTVFSFSQPQFSDDGVYAVIDINYKYCLTCGAGYTFIFRRNKDAWVRIGFKKNWGGMNARL